MALRRPQREAFDKVHELFRFLDTDLVQTPRLEVLHKVKDLHPNWSFAADFPTFTIALATGVGKTRLMGAIAAYLFLSRQSSNFLLLAPRDAILRKFEAEADPGSSKYLFVDSSLVPAPRVCFRGNVESFDFAEAELNQSPNLFIFSPQSLIGDDRRVARSSEFTGWSVIGFLKSRPDLVAFVDEAHHLGRIALKEGQAWTQGIRDLSPRLQIGLTATPREEVGSNVLYSYDLATCLREKLYTKGVRVIVRQRAKEFDDDEWDHHTLDFAIDRLTRKAVAIAQYRGSAPFPEITPVLLVSAENTAHANKIGAWLRSSRGFHEDEVLVTHSEKTKTEDDLARLVGIELPGNKVKVIVNVFELTEGWDVTNVFVIAPLRRMGTFQGAVQTMGRGLRLPAGRRIEDIELDSLDILCFGKESLSDVLRDALKDFGDEEEAETGVSVALATDPDFDRPIQSLSVQVDACREFALNLPVAHRLPVEPDLEFDPRTLRTIATIPAAEFELTQGAVVGSAEGLKYPYQTFVRLVAGRVMNGLRYLSEPLHRPSIDKLVIAVLDQRGIRPNDVVELDWMKVVEFIVDQIDVPYRKKDSQFKVATNMVRVSFKPYEWNVAVGQDAPLSGGRSLEWDTSMYRRLVSDWRKCTHKAAAFESGGELRLAQLLDKAGSVDWWSRNDPPRLRIPTPIGFYEPDFVVGFNGRPTTHLLLECKRADFWKPPESDARVKARAADAWASAVSRPADQWEHWVVLDADVPDCEVVEDLARIRANSP